MTNAREKVEDIVVVPQKSEQFLNHRQLEDYRSFRRDLINWISNLGKNPERAEGYAYATARQRSYKIDEFYRWIWTTQEDGYTLNATVGHADEYSKQLAYSDDSQSYKAGIQKAVKTLFKYLRHEKNRDIDWDPEIQFSNGGSNTHQVRDFLTDQERRKIKQQVLEYGSIPHYNTVTPEEREQWKRHLAQRFEKPKDQVTKQDWKRANGWKFPSIIYATMDAGFRPVEVGRATTSWLDLENQMLRIPKEDSTKNTENWHVALSERTTQMLKNWINERENYQKYQDTDQLWLTQYGNPYQSESLNQHLKKLCREAGIPTENRDLTWYSIRHSVGTKMSQEHGTAAVQQQLRQKSEEMAVRYDQAPVTDRKNIVNNWD